jgi:hypothetical protein
MDWFERVTGFRETSYEATRQRLVVAHGGLVNERDGTSRAIGELELVSLATLRERLSVQSHVARRSNISLVVGDVRELHRAPEYAGAVFQVASQFNLLEMISPDISPEHGVTRYAHDRTQGPACAMAAGAATIFRNYLAPIDGAIGQTASRQLDGLAQLGRALSSAMQTPVAGLWEMRNGYALCSESGLKRITAHVRTLDEAELDRMRGMLCIGVCRDAEVTDTEGPASRVTQAFCSALPVAYSGVRRELWRHFASLVLEAAYEATLTSAVLNARRGASRTVLLTLLGGGAFGNDREWILRALRRALACVMDSGLDIRIVSYGRPDRELMRLVDDAR